jgi:ankyrin repeat protein
MWPDSGCGCAGSSITDTIWWAASRGDLAEVERLVGQDPRLLDARDGDGRTPLMHASQVDHVGLVRWLLDKGAATSERHAVGRTALWYACCYGRLAVVKLLLERRPDPVIAASDGSTPLVTASQGGHLEVVRLLLGHPNHRATLHHGDSDGNTALWFACFVGRVVVARALLESGADPSQAGMDGITPIAIAKKIGDKYDDYAAGCQECVAALEVRSTFPLPKFSVVSWLRRGVLSRARWGAGGGAGLPPV